MWEIHTSDISLYRPVLRIHADETGTKERLDISNGIQRRHNRINRPVVCENRHLDRRPERLLDFIFSRTKFFHRPVPLTLSYRPVQDSTNLRSRQCISERSIGFGLVLLRERRLQIMPHMLQHGLLGILLHARVDCRKNFQAVGINIITFAVLLEILITPTVQRIVFPCHRIN